MKYLILITCFISHHSFAEEPFAVEPENKPVIVEFDRPNAISAELLGRGHTYTVAYDRLILEQLGVGVGFGYNVSTGLDITDKKFVIPLYANYYFSSQSKRFFLSGGISLVHSKHEWAFSATQSLTIEASGSYFNLGGGYESRSESGFLFRVTAYALFGSGLSYITDGKFKPWVGLSFGKVF